MIAGLLRMAGVWMGEEIGQANNEDRDFLFHGGLTPFRSEERRADLIERYRALIAKRNADHPVWG